MAKKKQDLIEEAKALGLDVDPKGKLSEIEEAIEVAKANLSDSEVEEKLHEAKEAKADKKEESAEKDEEVESEDKEEIEDSEDEAPDLTNPKEQVEPAVEKVRAKAGKRSTKAIKEAEEQQAKEERKLGSRGSKLEAGGGVDQDSKPKSRRPIAAKPRIERHGKKYREAIKQVDRTKVYPLPEALAIAQKTSITKFDASIELHIRLGVDPKQSEQNIRGTVALPAGTGKTIRVAVFGNDEDVKAAKTAGADIAAGDEFLEQLKKGEVNFDVLIATPESMGKLGPHAKLLGPKGLMPNPKSGTVTKDVSAAVKAAKAGQVEFRIDKQGIVHVAVGKVSFQADDLLKNAEALLKAIKDARPASLKGIYIHAVHVTTTMGPSIKLDLKTL